MNESEKSLEALIFNVERGLSVLIKTPGNHCILYDLGSTSELSPLKYMQRRNLFETFEIYREEGVSGKRIAQCIISHPHLDHISDLNIENTAFIANNAFYITCQNDKDDNKNGHSIDFSRINNPEEACDEIENYKSLYKGRNLPLSTLIHTEEELYCLKIGYYYITHKQAEELFPEDDQEYSNSLSLVLYLSYGNQSILIPGDITPDAFELIYNGRCEKRFTDYSIKQGEQKKKDWAKKTCDQPILLTLT